LGKRNGESRSRKCHREWNGQGGRGGMGISKIEKGGVPKIVSLSEKKARGVRNGGTVGREKEKRVQNCGREKNPAS